MCQLGWLGLDRSFLIGVNLVTEFEPVQTFMLYERQLPTERRLYVLIRYGAGGVILV